MLTIERKFNGIRLADLVGMKIQVLPGKISFNLWPDNFPEESKNLPMEILAIDDKDVPSVLLDLHLDLIAGPGWWFSLDKLDANSLGNGFGYFQPGARVTICADPDGQHPRKLGFVKRLGTKLAWRLAESKEWYSAETGVRIGYSPVIFWARPYQVGDEAAILAEAEAIAAVQAKKQQYNLLQQQRRFLEKRLCDTRQSIRYCSERVMECQASARRALAEAKNQEDQITLYQTQMQNLQQELVEFDTKLVAWEK